MTFHIPEESVHRAFEVLRSADHARKRAAAEFSEKNLKVIFARCLLSADGKTVGEREAAALCSQNYGKALEGNRLVAEAYYEARDLRDAASALIEAWRTQQSDQRAMGRVAA